MVLFYVPQKLPVAWFATLITQATALGCVLPLV
jgi:hypothetical protein